MKIKVASYFVNLGKQKYTELSKLCEQLDKKYCFLHNYDFQFLYLENKEMDIVDCLYYKLQFIYQQLMKNDCDYLVYLDADATISNPNIKIEDLIDNQHQLFLSRGNDRIGEIMALNTIFNALKQKMNTDNFINSSIDNICTLDINVRSACEHIYLNISHNEGLYIVKNTPLMKQFWKNCINLAQLKRQTIGYYSDGRIVCIALNMKKYNDKYTHLYDQAQGGVANVFETHYDVDKTFVLHNYGDAMTIDQKIEWIKSLKYNKWWNEYFKNNDINNVE